MKTPNPRLIIPFVCLLPLGPLSAAELAHEAFDYSASQPLTSLGGGSGWSASWVGDGQVLSASVRAQGLSFTDAVGNVLHVSGRAADTTAASTTRSFRTISTTPINDVWISFLWNLGATNSLFEGLTFYRGSSACFAVTNPTTTTTASLFLGNSLTGGSFNSGRGSFGATHLVVLRLAKGAGTNGGDLLQMFVDPSLSATPSTPVASTTGTNFDFDTIRIAGQNGATFVFDEFRIGTTFADVTPHDVPPNVDLDSDGDGLSDAEEIVLGTDPYVSNAGLFAAIKSNPHYFGLYDANGIRQQTEGGVVIQKFGTSSVPFSLEIQQSENLESWPLVETITRSVTLPDGKNFLRVTLEK